MLFCAFNSNVFFEAIYDDIEESRRA